MLRLIAAIMVSLVVSPLQVATADAAEAVRQPGALAPGGVLRSQFAGLQAELQRHRSLAASGGWPVVPKGPTIRPGSDDPRLGILAKRLAASGDLADDEIVARNYGEALQDAVRRFQARHGLATDALVGRATLRALNVPIEERIDQIRVNLERTLAVSDMDEDFFVLVSIAAFKAAIIRDGQTIWTMKVIVGGKDNETPELRSVLKSVVFNPTWSVPRSIATEEMLPDIKQDPDFFAKGGYELYDREGNRVDPALVDWSTFSKNNFPFRLVQKPGPGNQLGQIKFMIPNRYSVCMHDTPAKYLFASSKRALSHGCIRIDDPLAFAEFVLRVEGWTRDEIDSQIESGNTKTIALAKPLPVYVLYMTAEVDDLGRIHFYNDVYGRDASVLKALDARAEDSTGQPVRRRR